MAREPPRAHAHALALRLARALHHGRRPAAQGATGGDMTERLYLADPYLRAFRARVVAMRELDGKPAALLDRSAFYPEGGGQPGDRGTLGGARVLDTQERDGEILHVIDKPLTL